MNRILVTTLFIAVGWISASAERELISLNTDWTFRFSHQVQPRSEQQVDLPHTWNTTDALVGKPDYFRGTGIYEKKLPVRPEWAGKRLFLRFEGANTITQLFVNGKYVGEHRGGYGAFVFELTDWIQPSGSNRLTVKVSNALTQDVMPLVGDFNMYGGIYRDVYLLVTDSVCISPTDYASPGIYLTQSSVTEKTAEVETRVIISNATASVQPVKVEVKVWDGEKLIREVSGNQAVSQGENQLKIPFTINNPHLWNGVEDPFIYQTEIILSVDGKVIDRIIQPLGLRYFRVDAEKGFFLNGKPLKLRGVCRHQDRPKQGNALLKEHHDEDAAIMAEMGTNAVRLAHYPQAAYFYELMDQYGLVVWAEIPFIGPGGYLDQGFTNQPSFRENGKEQLRELIRQHYNHPSICFLGLFNELKTQGDNPTEYVKELNEIAHREDPTRLTASATFLSDNDPINRITDVIAWNKYMGWYGGKPADLGKWADRAHRSYPSDKIAVSEYGAGASIYHQQDSLTSINPSGWWHPENVQTAYHIDNWKEIAERPYLWGSFIWNLFDFGAAHRTEGDRPGINDKGIVTFDRTVKKDAFYFYKANWNKKEPFVYIANRRNRERTNPDTEILVFSNLPELELRINSKSIGKLKADKYATFRWTNVKLASGENRIEVNSTGKKDRLNDSTVWCVK